MGQDFQGDPTVEACIVGAVDRTHAAFAELAIYLVMGEGVAGLEIGGRFAECGGGAWQGGTG